MDILKTAYRRRSDVVKRRIAGETLLIPIRGEIANMEILFVLDPTAEFIWDRLDGTRTGGDILQAVVESFDVEAQTAGNDLAGFIAELEKAQIVEQPE